MTVIITNQPVPFLDYCCGNCLCFPPRGHLWFNLCLGAFSLAPLVRYTAFSARGGSSIARSSFGCFVAQFFLFVSGPLLFGYPW